MSTTELTPIAQCDRCGAELTPGTRFCSNCGQPIGAAPTSAEPAYWGDAVSNAQPLAPSTIPQLTAAFDTGGDGGMRKLFSASGRIGRLEYFLTTVGVWGALIVSAVIIGLVDVPALTLIVAFGAWMVAMIVSVCAGIKRLHDFDQSGWLYLIFLIPFAGFIMFLVLIFKGSSPGLNQYGYADSGSVKG